MIQSQVSGPFIQYTIHIATFACIQQEGAGPSTDIMTKLSKIQEENKKRYNLEKSIVSDCCVITVH